MNWILFGFKSVGKTHFGRLLGAKSHIPFLDIDELIEKKAKLSIPGIVRKKGEQAFRKLEEEVITNLCVENHIISVGGGSVLCQNNLRHLQNLGKLIYLKGPKNLIKKRLLTPPLPSYLDPKDPEGSFEKMYCTRILKYETISSFTVHVGAKSEPEILEELWQVINSVTSFV